MKINIFTFADSVNTYDEGKLVIIGTFDNIQAEKCPFTFRPFGIALKLSAEPRDYGKNYKTILILRKAGTQRHLMEMPLPLSFPTRSKGKRVTAVFAANIGGAKFDSFGTYILELRVGSKPISQIKINVVRKVSAKKGSRARPKKKRKAAKSKARKTRT